MIQTKGMYLIYRGIKRLKKLYKQNNVLKIIRLTFV
jgi:hypothetical protein